MTHERRSVSRNGNSLTVSIPKRIRQRFNVTGEQSVSIRTVNHDDEPTVVQDFDEPEPEPACKEYNGNSWAFEIWSERLGDWFEPCERCFESADVLKPGMSVIRAKNAGDVVHRPPNAEPDGEFKHRTDAIEVAKRAKDQREAHSD
jgi:antitoxin component of MazEF toxin-antitoxin module